MLCRDEKLYSSATIFIFISVWNITFINNLLDVY